MQKQFHADICTAVLDHWLEHGTGADCTEISQAMGRPRHSIYSALVNGHCTEAYKVPDSKPVRYVPANFVLQRELESARRNLAKTQDSLRRARIQLKATRVERNELAAENQTLRFGSKAAQ